MAFRTWGKLLLTALGVSMLAGAGQLGIAYGFGIVRLTGDFTDVNRWPAQLAWVGWFAVTAAVVGAVLTGRLARREGLPEGTPVQLAISGVAALGALVVAPLCMQPARAADLNAVDPVWAVGICAVAGAVVGAGAASAVLLRPPLGWNVALLGGTVWLVALLSVAPAVLSSEPLRTVRLGVLEPSWLGPDGAQRLAMLLLPVIALVAGAVTGGLARRRGHPPLIGGAAGVAGPVLLAFAYLTAGPGDQVDRYQLAPYYGAVIAVVTGALGSVAATLARWPLLPARTARRDGGTAIEPTDILAPLPAVPDPARTAAAGSGPDRGTLACADPAGTGADEQDTVDLSAAAGSLHPDQPDAALSRTAAGAEADTGPGWPSPDVPGTGRHPAHWDWPDPAATVADRHAPRTTPSPTGPAQPGSTRVEPVLTGPWAGSTPTGPTSTGSAPIDPVPGPTGPPPTGPDATADPDKPAGAEPGATSPAEAGSGRAGSPRSRAGQRKAAPPEQPGNEVGVEQEAGTGPAPGDGPVATPKPRAKWASRARSAATGGGALPFPEPGDAGQPDAPQPVSLRWEPEEPHGTAPVAGSSPDPDQADPAPGDGSAPERTGKAKGRRGLFRRNRSPQDAPADEAYPKSATPDDEEYVDWVTGLGKPLADNEPDRDSGRRSLRTSGRHHRD
ncbi:hypothetical protein [Micromonospora sp. HUAS LYJ1]|uniref:hypothetical protein n=1 Tax=Micromonospora sp. HUAS LYJ1 TaxID=3061626 RepID=UPI0026721B7B|nr:hypothetical protein [Micromonospora sp. HUAS LYJ1]WKU02462.1 hypothetical protein Q2K16_16150 [Micromonospora sp. HUAS LYJ1]